MKRRILAILMAAFMLFSAVPSAVFAEDDHDHGHCHCPGEDELHSLETCPEAELIDWKNASLNMSNDMAVRFGITADAPDAYTYEITINGKTTVYTGEDLVSDANGVYYLYFRGIMATQFDYPITAVIKKDGVQVGRTLTYSVNTYILNNQNDEGALGDLLRALINYSKSAEAYASQSAK